MKEKVLTILAGLLVMGLLYLVFAPQKAEAQFPNIMYHHYLVSPENIDLWVEKVYGEEGLEGIPEGLKQQFANPEAGDAFWIRFDREEGIVCHTWLVVEHEAFMGIVKGLLDPEPLMAHSIRQAQLCEANVLKDVM